MGDRIGRNGRFLGKRGPDIDKLDDKSKKRLLEISGIQEDDIREEERDELMKALLESNPDFLKGTNGSSSSNSSSPVRLDDDQEEDDATQPPHEIVDQVYAETDFRGGLNNQRDEGRLTYKDASGKKVADLDSSQQDQRKSRTNVPRNTRLPNADNSGLMAENSSEGHEDTEATADTHTAEILNGSNQPEVNNLPGNPEKADEETQLYVAHLVEDTQRSEESDKAETDVIIPESPDNESNVNVEMPLPDIRVEKEYTGGSQTLPSQKNYTESTFLLQALNPLWPALYKGSSNSKKDCYSEVVKLMFDLYRLRVCREQRKLTQSLSWGNPVVTGPHEEGCLRSMSSKRGYPSSVIGESYSRKERILRRHGNDKFSSSSKDDPYVLNISDNEDRDDSEDDFERTNCAPIFRASAQPKAGQEDENGACNLSVGGSSRRSARLCTMKLTQARMSESEEGDQGDEDEWHPEQRKTKGKNNFLKRKGLRRVQKKSDKKLGESHSEKSSAQDFGNLLNVDRKEDRDETSERSKVSFEENPCLETKKASLKTPRDIVIDNENVNMDSSSPKWKYQFDSESDSDSNQKKATPSSRIAEAHKNYIRVENQQVSSEKVIILSDSDQSNDTGKGEQLFAASSYSFESSGPDRKRFHDVEREQIVGPLVRGTSNANLSRTRKQQKLKGETAAEDQESSPLKRDVTYTTVTGSQSELTGGSALLREKIIPEDQLSASDAGNELSQDLPSDEPSWSQSSNSLLDKDGQLFSTQIHRQQKKKLSDINELNESTRKLPQRTSNTTLVLDVDMPEVNDRNESFISLSESRSQREHRKKRKAIDIEDSCSKRPIHAGDLSEHIHVDNSVVLDAKDDDEDIDKGILMKHKGLNLISSNKRKRLDDVQNLQLSTTEDKQFGGDVDGGGEAEKQRAQARIEDQQQHVQARDVGVEDVPRQASLLEELTSEVDEKALQACPICSKEFPLIAIEAHASTCGENVGEDERDQNQHEPDRQCNPCGEKFSDEDIQEHVQNCELVRYLQAENSSGRITRSRRGNQGLK